MDSLDESGNQEMASDSAAPLSDLDLPFWPVKCHTHVSISPFCGNGLNYLKGLRGFPGS